ncbi:MAG TPA: ATP-binding cassette domain-containing protein [Chloroflexia bacterium]|nr:ATP-binding cassette domain-containing protein [Chloroflexia bacterium]
MIKTEKLSRRFGEFLAVDNLNLEVKEGEIFGFLGPNGAGKTTTIRMLCALMEPSAGRAWVNGYEIGSDKSNDKVRASIGLLTEAPGLYELLNAMDNMVFYAQLYGLSAQEASIRAEETLRWLDLWPWRKEPVGTFSKGMKQKLAIGRALLHQPKVLFLDEPTSSLDAESSHTVREAIFSLKETGRTIFLSTHNMDEANRLCDRIAIFKHRLLQLDTPLNLRRHFDIEDRRIIVRLRNQPPTVVQALRQLPFVKTVRWLEQNESQEGYTLEVRVSDPEKQNPALVRKLVELDAEVQYLEENTPDLEEVYLAITR